MRVLISIPGRERVLMSENEQPKPESTSGKPSNPDVPNPRLLQSIRESENELPPRLHELVRGIERPEGILKEDGE